VYKYCEGLDAGRVAIKYAMKALWGDWDGGSTIFFWSWPPDFFEGVRSPNIKG
jgi:hypothetical protein